jgi:hypothetical protein
MQMTYSNMESNHMNLVSFSIKTRGAYKVAWRLGTVFTRLRIRGNGVTHGKNV